MERACLMTSIAKVISQRVCMGLTPSLIGKVILQLGNLGSARLSSMLPAAGLLVTAVQLLSHILKLLHSLQAPVCLLTQRLLQSLVGWGSLHAEGSQ